MRKIYVYQNLDGYNFTGAELVGANFSHASLRETVFTHAQLDYADFRYADMTDVKLLARPYFSHAALSPDGTWLASGTYFENHNILLWNLQDEGRIRTLPGHFNNLTSLAFHPHKPYLVSGGSDYTIHFWNLNNGRREYTLPIKGMAEHLSFSPDGYLLAEYDSEGKIFLIDIVNKKQIQELPGMTSAFAFSNDSHFFAVASKRGEIILWDVVKQQKIGVFRIPGKAHALSFYPFSNHKIFVLMEGKSRGRDVWLIDLATGIVQSRLRDSQEEQVPYLDNLSTMTVLPWNAQIVVSDKNNHAIELWDMITHKKITAFHLKGHYIENIYVNAHTQSLIVPLQKECAFIDLNTQQQRIIHPKPACKGANIFGVKGLTSQQRELLLEGGAVEIEKRLPRNSSSARHVHPLEDQSMAKCMLLDKYRKNAGDIYTFTVSVERDGSILFAEEYFYAPQKNEPARKYIYSLSIFGYQARRFLIELAHASKIEPAKIAHIQKNPFMLYLLEKLIQKGIFTAEEDQKFTANLQAIRILLEHKDIPYELSLWRWADID
ncbi:WD40 repeat domain-containing protein [Dictyobacter arantiisoli]|uniref:Uncharacterized protein n=1 Tax=Dictyobacter arantiisoli TaxID=2014874 RepID=A0A5A5TA97_9CHLR|nr:pentapeptide repeat-containing protein [Dictyobacter arantiisoli]GCF07824.1 hypothetical protein KDI_13880 [Dictyobacter arantiisoli]